MSNKRPLALVTGGAGALGSAIAAALVRDGWRVALADRDATALDLVGERLGPVNAPYRQAIDVRDEVSVRSFIARVAADNDGLQGLATAAGGGPAFGPRALFWETGQDDWRLNVETHLLSVMVTCHAALPHLIEAGNGVIMNVASGRGCGAALRCHDKNLERSTRSRRQGLSPSRNPSPSSSLLVRKGELHCAGARGE